MDYIGTNSQGTANAPNGMSDQLLGTWFQPGFPFLGAGHCAILPWPHVRNQEKRFPREHFTFAREEKRFAREHFAFARQEKRFPREHFAFPREQKRFPRERDYGVYNSLYKDVRPTGNSWTVFLQATSAQPH